MYQILFFAFISGKNSRRLGMEVKRRVKMVHTSYTKGLDQKILNWKKLEGLKGGVL